MSLNINTVNPPLKISGSGAYPEAWELDISLRIDRSWEPRTVEIYSILEETRRRLGPSCRAAGGMFYGYGLDSGLQIIFISTVIGVEVSYSSMRGKI